MPSYILLQRGWQAVAGLGTLLILTHTLSLAEQGWYYAFLSVSAVYVVLDFGLSALLVQISAREFMGLRWDRNGGLEGDGTGSFYAFCRRVGTWYAGAAVVYLALIPFGFYFFGQSRTDLHYDWHLPWILTVAATCANQLVLPWPAIVEGTGGIREAYLVRFIQNGVGTSLLWLALYFDAGLYAAAIAPLCGFLVGCIWLVRTKAGLVGGVLRTSAASFDWRKKVLPLQWRMGISWICGYLLVQIHVPLLFRTQGPEAAGKMGLTLTVANMIGLLAQSWVTSRVPRMTQLAARQDWKAMDSTFSTGFRIAALAYVCGAATVVAARHLLEGTAFADRVLPQNAFVGLMVAGLVAHVTGLLSSQVRSYLRDPFVAGSVVAAAMTVVGVLWAAPRYSYSGVVAVMVAVNVGIGLPWVVWLYRRCNRLWRAERDPRHV